MNQDLKHWHNLEAMLIQLPPHVHTFEPTMAADLAYDDVYYYGRCVCGATEV